MGWVSNVGDFSTIIYNPASVNDFADQFSATVGRYNDTAGVLREYLGSFLLKKSLGKMINVGVIANTKTETGSSMLRSDFYSHARDFLLQSPEENLPTSFPMVPHLVLGIDFGSVGLAIEGWVENVSFRNSNHRGAERDVFKTVQNIGLKLNSNIYIKNFWFCPVLGYSAPHINGEISGENSYRSDMKKFITCGAELGTEISKFSYAAGLYYTIEEYMFRDNSRETPHFKTEIYEAYFGVSTYLMEKLFFACIYSVNLWNEYIYRLNVQEKSRYHGRYIWHELKAGVEKTIRTNRVLDNVIPRAGFYYGIEYIDETTVFIDSERADVRAVYPPTVHGVFLTTGIGLEKGIFGLDLAFNFGTWNGVFTGPQIASATLTVGLSEKFLQK